MTWTILTGGQTGVDTGALLAAEKLGLRWKAYLPRGLRREKPMPKWMFKWALELMTSDKYEDRTKTCVQQADVVMVLGQHLQTPGTRLTVELAHHYDKLVIDQDGQYINLGIQQWRPLGSGVLMVAGPRGSKWPEGSARAYKKVMALFRGA